MTHDECKAALARHDRRAVALACVAEIWRPCLVHCSDDALTAVAWALDSARRWALTGDAADATAAHAAAALAYAAHAAAALAYAAHAAAYVSDLDAAANAAYAAADAAYAAADAAYSASTYDSANAAASASGHAGRAFGAAAYAARARLVRRLRDAPPNLDGYIAVDGNLVGPTHVWRRIGPLGGKWERREKMKPAALVRLDAVMEATT